MDEGPDEHRRGGKPEIDFPGGEPPVALEIVDEVVDLVSVR